jgi:hypothetical protein
MRKFINKYITLPLLSPLETADPSPIMAVSSVTSLWWAIVFLIGCGSSGAGCFIDNVTSLMVVHAEPSFWILVFALSGIGTIVARTKNCLWLERAAMLFSVALWSFVSALLVKENPLSFVSGTYIAMTLISAWAYWRLGYE